MSEEVKRLSPLKETLTRLFAFSGNRCAYPDCKNLLIDEDNNFVGQVCHIESAMKGGERFNQKQTNEERRYFSNLLLLCYPHHVKTNNVDKYPVIRLKEIKANHEKHFKEPASQFLAGDELINNIYNELLNSIKQDTTAIRKETMVISEVTADTNAMAQQILNIVKQQTLDSGKAGPTDFKEEIDEILKFRDKNQQRVALQLFEQLKAKKWPVMNDVAKYRVSANMGVCHLELFENQKASDYLIECLSYQSENIRAINYAALGYMLRNETEKSKELIGRALQIDPGFTDIYLPLIFLHKKGSSFKHILKIVPVAIRQNAQVAFALSVVARDYNNLNEAIKWANVCLENTDTNQVDLKSNLAALILESIHNSFKIASGQSSREAINKAKYVVQLYDESWEVVKDTDLRKSRGWWLRNRGSAKWIMGDLDGAFTDIASASELSPGYDNLRQLAILCVQTGKLERAWEILDRIEPLAEKEESEDVQVFRAEIRAIQHRFPEAIQIVENLIAANPAPTIDIHAKELLLKIFVNTGQINAAREIIIAIKSTYPDRITPYVLSARLYRDENKPDKIPGELILGMACINDLSSLEDIRTLAMEFVKEKDFARAILLMEKITDKTVLSPLSEDLIKLYYEAGETGKLLAVCTQLINTYGPNHTLTEHQVVTYQRLNDLPNAIKACENYLKIYPDDQRIIVRLLLIHYNNNDRLKIIEYMGRINSLDRHLPYNIQFKVALVFFLNGEKEKCYDLAYETRKQYFDKKHAHELFFGLLMGIGSTIAHPADPEEVRIGSAAIVKHGEAVTNFVITNKGTSHFLLDEISEIDPIAVKLLGKRKGDTLDFREEPGEEPYILINILHRYNFAYMESLRLLQDKFVVGRSIRQFSFGTSGDSAEDVKPLFEELNKLSKQQQDFQSWMNTNHVTIGSLSAFSRQNPIMTWANLLPFSAPGIITTNGTEEFQTACQAIAYGQGILFDIISLFTLNTLGILDLVASLPNNKVVSQSSLNLLNELIRGTELSINGSVSIIPFDGKIIRHAVSAEEIKARVEKLHLLHEWITENCEVLPCNETANMLLSEKQAFDDLIGESFADSLLTAKEKGYLLFAEEGNLRSLGHSEYQLNGLGTFTLLAYSWATKLIDQKKYNDLVVSLVALNYKGLPADSSVVIHAFETYKDLKNPIFIRTITSIISGMFTTEQMLHVSAHLFYKLLNNSLFRETFGEQTDQEVISLITAILNLLTKYLQPRTGVHQNLCILVNGLANEYADGKDFILRLIEDYFSEPKPI